MADLTAANRAPGSIDIRDVVAWVKEHYGGADYHSAPFLTKREWILEYAASQGKAFLHQGVPEAAALLIRARSTLRAMPEPDRYAVAELLIRLEECLHLAAVFNPAAMLSVNALPPFEWPELAAPDVEQPRTIH